MSSRARAFALATLAAIAMALPLAIGTRAADAAPRVPVQAISAAHARSVLVIALPATAWTDLRGDRLPNLTRLLRSSAMADLATRAVRSRTDAGTGYLALGSGARVVGDGSAAGMNLERNEPFENSTAGEVFRLRTGRSLTSGVGALGWPGIQAENNSLTYGAEPGRLGQTLDAAHFGRTVIANADRQGIDAPELHREAALALMDSSGRVPGAVNRLLVQDPNAPFGQRLDPAAVMEQFPRDFQSRRQVVIVEASDLARADAYRPLADPAQRATMHMAALRATDRLVGRLLKRVDLRRDAVAVIAPYHSGRARTLTVAAIRAPGLEPGLLESATTRRTGFVQIVDVAPTILDLVGIRRPDAMEGRPARVSSTDASYQRRLDALVRLDRASQFRDQTIGAATVTLVTSTIVLVVLAIFGFGFFRNAWFRIFLRWASLAFLGYVAATFGAGVFPMYRWGTGTYFTIVAIASVGFAALCLAAGRRALVDPILIALGIVVAMHLGDLVSGAHLELNTVFGYSPTVGIRLAGIGNPGSAELCSAALLVAILLPHHAVRRGDVIGLVLLIVTFLIVAAPMFGQDFGGALSLGPTLALWWLLRSGRRVRVRTILILAGVLVGAGLIAGVVDLARPANERTHVGRLFEKVGSDGIGSFFTVVGRKATLMIATFSNTALVLLVLSVAVALALSARRSTLFTRVTTRVPTLRAGLLCFALLALLGTALNDSGVQVTAMMAATLLPVLVYLATRVDDEAGADDAAARAFSAPTPARSRA